MESYLYQDMHEPLNTPCGMFTVRTLFPQTNGRLPVLVLPAIRSARPCTGCSRAGGEPRSCAHVKEEELDFAIVSFQAFVCDRNQEPQGLSD